MSHVAIVARVVHENHAPRLFFLDARREFDCPDFPPLWPISPGSRSAAREGFFRMSALVSYTPAMPPETPEAEDDNGKCKHNSGI